jgi:hypothetical protein
MMHLMQFWQKGVRLKAALCVALVPVTLLAAKRPKPVGAVATQAFRISTTQGSALEPFIISLDWTQPQPQITRAVIIFHGKGRDVEGYYRTALEAGGMAGPAGDETVLIAPQFLDQEDMGAYHVSGEVLRWRSTDWEAGAPAVAPAAISSYEVVDALLARLANRSVFPRLQTVVLAGHSGGGQLVHRYAIVGRAVAALASSGVHLRFVVANPSSYVYFSDERPAENGALAPFQGGACPHFNHWKYGPLDAPSYVALDADHTWRQLEADYAQRDVIYLLGTADTDPREKDLDVTCSGEAQGPTRFARGQAYYAYLHTRHPSGWNQRLWFVPGVAHSARQMFTSRCGVGAIFDSGPCPDQ